MPYDKGNQQRPKINRRMQPMETRHLCPDSPKQPIPEKRKKEGVFQFLQDHLKLAFLLGILIMFCLLIVLIPFWNSFNQKNNILSQKTIQNPIAPIQSTYNYSVGTACASFGDKAYSENKVDSGHTLVV